jgi:hypothetical protein
MVGYANDRLAGGLSMSGMIVVRDSLPVGRVV